MDTVVTTDPVLGVRHTSPGPLPPGACDCHVHVFGPSYAFDGARTYTPPEAPLDALRAHQRALGLDRVVVVQPSVYGTDNHCTLDAVDALGPSARAVAVIAPGLPRTALRELHSAGVRGVRVNLETAGLPRPGRRRPPPARCRGPGGAAGLARAGVHQPRRHRRPARHADQPAGAARHRPLRPCPRRCRSGPGRVRRPARPGAERPRLREALGPPPRRRRPCRCRPPRPGAAGGQPRPHAVGLRLAPPRRASRQRPRTPRPWNRSTPSTTAWPCSGSAPGPATPGAPSWSTIPPACMAFT